nr:hypothetical protein [Fodinicola feengrottensis]
MTSRISAPAAGRAGSSGTSAAKTPSGMARAEVLPYARTTSYPAALSWPAASASSRLFPIPAGPTSTAPPPATLFWSRTSSSFRPTNGSSPAPDGVMICSVIGADPARPGSYPGAKRQLTPLL